jgi:aldehyde:ferredoxin oxidoreductase
VHGVWGKLLDIDLSSNRVSEYSVEEEAYRKFLGGRGLATYILWRELGLKWSEIDPLGPENLLIVMTGPLTGYYPGSKVIVTGKSPQSYGVIGSGISTGLAQELKRCGYDGIIVRGVAKEPVYLLVTDDKVEIRDVKRLWGLGGLELFRALKDEVRIDFRLWGIDDYPKFIYIGPAGENMVRVAAVMADLTHAGGYGGYGAVMGSKKLKAIVVKGRKALPPPADLNRVKELLSSLMSKAVPLMRLSGYRLWGTPEALWDFGFVRSSAAVRNWQEEWHDKATASHAALEWSVWIKHYRSCPYCLNACMHLSGPFHYEGRTLVTDGPDYEMAQFLGPNLGIYDAESIAKLSALADYLGLCGIQTGSVIGFAMELYERGILTRDDLGYELRWGDVDAVIRVMCDIAYRRGFGEILAEGVYRASIRISKLKNIDVSKYAVHFKGVAPGSHGIRSRRDYQPIAYAVSVQGGDHMSVGGLPADTMASESWRAVQDSAVVCKFASLVSGYDEVVAAFISAVTGLPFTRSSIYGDVGPRILTLQRVLLLLGGPDVFWDPRLYDDNPPRWYEPLPSGPYKGSYVPRDEVERLKKEYYKALGWNELGLPTEETLRRLGLEELSPAIEIVKKRFEALG